MYLSFYSCLIKEGNISRKVFCEFFRICLLFRGTCNLFPAFWHLADCICHYCYCNIAICKLPIVGICDALSLWHCAVDFFNLDFFCSRNISSQVSNCQRFCCLFCICLFPLFAVASRHFCPSIRLLDRFCSCNDSFLAVTPCAVIRIISHFFHRWSCLVKIKDICCFIAIFVPHSYRIFPVFSITFIQILINISVISICPCPTYVGRRHFII